MCPTIVPKRTVRKPTRTITQKFRRGVAAIWLRYKRTRINSTPSVRSTRPNPDGNLRSVHLPEDTLIEERLRLLPSLRRREKTTAFGVAKTKNDQQNPLSQSKSDRLLSPYYGQGPEFDALSRRLREIRTERSNARRNALVLAKKIAGKK